MSSRQFELDTSGPRWRHATDPELVYDYKVGDVRFLRAFLPLPVGLGVFAAVLAIGAVPVRRVEKRKQRIGEARCNKDLLTREYTAQTLEDAQRAEEHIDQLYRMERGDVDVRKAHLAELREDATHAHTATAEAGDEELADGVEKIIQRLDALAANPQDPAFMDTFVRMLGDYRLTMEALQRRQFTARDGVDDYAAPRLWEPEFRYPGYVSYRELRLWDATDNSPSSDNGTNSGFSSGFSGSGGSSSF